MQIADDESAPGQSEAGAKNAGGAVAATAAVTTAGAEAEEQLAFYLRRSFFDVPDLLVINDLRLKDSNQDRAQIDHIVLHKYGFIIIESKSVCSEVKVNSYGEWSRLWNRRYEGMPSPIHQAKRQIEFLKRVLNAYCDGLVSGDYSSMQAKFDNCPFDILVAVSDDGTIQREIGIDEVVKADQVPERIRDIVKKADRNSSDSDVGSFSEEEMRSVVNFLVRHHYPLKNERSAANSESVRKTPPPPPEAAPKSPATNKPASDGLGICPKCGGQGVIVWGHNYYWKCTACQNNFPLNEFCPTCRQKMMLRKAKNTYFIFCGLCKTPERPYCKFVVE